ncbi:MAG: hypothetical protein AAFV43_04770 [Planctomycetota bacterium]
MKVFYAAIAAALMASGVGCSAVNSCGSGMCDPCGIPGRCGVPGEIGQGRCMEGPGLMDRLGWTRRGVDCGEMVCFGDGCATGACQDGCYGGACGGGPCGSGQNCMTGCIDKLLNCPGACGKNGMCTSGDANYNFNPGPPVGQVGYPYYTVRGPRDFLMANPPTIGPR